ncbi:MAG TPA: arsenate reductase ArsC [Candidatus Poseidoniaceae archaeon]|nr:MAG TPA: arsenate reductase ArsC [Candidatus Poseidoniales archaeon]HII45484.1 arsenate reductase ArsC [Candidatus Poseidoniaceae archaeon]
MRILFVCVGNSCRSQMAEGIAKFHGHDAASAGTHPANNISTNAITVLENMGIDTTGMKPKNLTLFDVADFDLIISMGCGVECPSIKLDDDWQLEDPVGQSITVFEETAREIQRRILELQ